MTETTFDRPYRTPFMRGYNRAGTWLRARGHARPLSAEKILRTARFRTGLSDFGPDFFREPLDILVESFEKDARLNPLGRTLIHETLANFAANRLRVQRAFDDRPAALDERIERPVFVLGLPRTGTTLLQELLSCDPARRPLLCWESFFPARLSPRIGRFVDLRPQLMRLVLASLNRAAPQLRDVHPMHWDAPEECTWLTANTFMSSAFTLFGRVERYEAWLDAADDRLADLAYEDYARQLRVLQHGSRRRPWILKSPVHLRALASLLRVFPDARVLRTRRRPTEVVASSCSLFAIVRGKYSDDVHPHELGREALMKLRTAYRRADLACKSAGPRVLDVEFRDLMKDPIATIHGILSHFGEELDDLAALQMRAWLARHPAPAGHRYSLQQFGITETDVQDALGGPTAAL